MMKLPQMILVLLFGASLALAVLSPQVCAAFTIQEVASFTQASNDLPVVKSVALSPNMDAPWSKLVRIVDPFEGEFLGVFDRNSLGANFYPQSSIQIISLWTASSIRVIVTLNYEQAKSSFYTAGRVYPKPDNIRFVTTKKVDKFLLKVRNKVFQLDGSTGTFAVSRELAAALKNAPDENLKIRLVLEGSQTVDSEIGKGTVKIWRNIY